MVCNISSADKIISTNITPKLATSPPHQYSLSPSSPLSPAGSPKTPSTPSPSPPRIAVPCAACKILRRRCVEKCVLAPYFPPTEPLKFTIAHKVFGASNIIKMLQELPEDQRADAVNSMVYEANSRIRDPIYGCAGAICQLQKQISELQAELAKAQAEMLNLQCQNDNLRSFIICSARSSSSSMESQDNDHQEPISSSDDTMIISCPNTTNSENKNDTTSFFLDDENLYAAWEPLWT
ncbi:OLC1v1025895C1 [Oldenlandia corymbosa var. corymbosa]|uniref:OLC1v1025895C1 n=1 Tax=Oldenlandia corymbosa var. corymbosa TaxID=529605 RepID=A0AAV1C5R4_OLDCO|nr:OLC1v1025895C1 [Oldenlandia corymbosa var. corymbosa]